MHNLRYALLEDLTYAEQGIKLDKSFVFHGFKIMER